jgi:hypothetical protein
MKNLLMCLLFVSLFFGCARIDPFSPRFRQDIKNAGKIEELNTNQNSIVTEIGKLRQEQQIIARDMKEVQTGILNRQNTGIQIFQGDGALLAIITLSGMLMFSIVCVVYFKTHSDKNEKIANVLAKQIVMQNNIELEDNIFQAAMFSPIEKDIYHLMEKHQS